MDWAIRPATTSDIPAILEIQAASPQAAQWNDRNYLDHDCLVAEAEGCPVGFLVKRVTAPGEQEILNLATHPAWRRRSVARTLLNAVLALPGDWFLEVRESNTAAIALYRSLGFEVAGVRPAYYTEPVEAGIVMKFRS